MKMRLGAKEKAMKTLHEIMRVIISGIDPRSETGIRMELLAYHMAYDWRL